MKNRYKSYLVSLLFCAFIFEVSAQQQEITGKVTDTSKVPIPGVHIQLKEKNWGTTTNFDGEFSIKAKAEDTLVVSYMGYKRQKIAVAGRNFIPITLEAEENALQEVVINAGYYTTTGRERTGNIAKVTAEELELQPVTNPLEALQGRMAGVEIVQQTGVPGAAPSIRIRGQNSLRNTFDDNGNLPLYIVDGMPLNSSPMFSQNQMLGNIGIDPLNTLNVSNIESIEVLKDADATAIYGSRGANGVILITTKSGEGLKKETEVSARFYTGVSRVSHFVDLLNTEQYLNLRHQAFENDGVEPNEVNAYDLLVWDQNRYTNWQKKLFGGTASLSNMNLNVSGSGDRTSYLVGASYQKQGTVFPGDFSYQKKTFNFNLNHHSEDQKFKMNLSANYGIDENDLFSSATFVRSAFSLPPNAPAIYNEDGSFNWEGSTWTNPFATLENEGQGNMNNLIANMGLEYKLGGGLQIKTSLGYTRLNSEETYKIPIQSYDPAVWDYISNRSQHSLIDRTSWIAEPQLTYIKSFNNHQIEALIGGTFQESINSNLRMTATGYSNPHLIGNLAAADAVEVNEDREIEYKYNAIFARIGYNWKHTYFLNLTGRRDGSSRFGPGKRFANFGAIGAAWIFSKERFIEENLSFLSFGKLRGSYGRTGNDQIGDYRYLDAYEATPGPGGLYPTQLTNPNFSWEINKKFETGMQLGFIKDRINLNVSWYRNRSSNQLVGYPLPATTGFTSVEANLAATVENTGWEVELSTLNFTGKHLRWQTSFNLSLPENKLVKFDNIEETSYQNIYRVGKSLNLGILYNFQGVDPETGLYTVEDVNEDGRYDYDDRIVTKDIGRQYFGGLHNQLDYKGFSLGFLVEFVKQKGYKLSATPPGRLGNTLPHQVQLGSQGENLPTVQTASQSVYALLAYNNYAYNSDFAITDASFIRLKTLSLGYSVPKKLLKITGLKQLEIFLHGQNLFTLTDYVGLDPQQTNSYTLPALQSITGGFQLNF